MSLVKALIRLIHDNAVINVASYCIRIDNISYKNNVV